MNYSVVNWINKLTQNDAQKCIEFGEKESLNHWHECIID